ncbi:MAG TPA: ABC transporter permease [Mobilitalea sp.]|nr:ABC transporter permease [Mobilitalea sp.]
MFSVIVKDTREFLRDRVNLFFYILFPVMLIFLLGNLLANMDKAEDAIGTIRIQYQRDTTDPYQQQAVMNFIGKVKEENGMLQFEETSDIKAARQLAGEDEITAAVLFTGDPMEIQIYEGTNQLKNKAVSAIFSSFIQSDKAYEAVFESNPQALSGLVLTQGEYVEQKDLGIHRTMMDYYAVTMLAMVCFMIILVGTGAFMGERQSKTINRLIIAPQNRVFLFLQKILGMLPQVAIQIVVIMFICVVIFKAHYAANTSDNLWLFLMFLCVTLCMVALGSAIGIVLKANPMAVIMPVLWIMMFFGGTYSREMHVKGLTEAMPIYQIQQAAYDLVIFGHHEKANYVIVISLLIMLAALITGAFLFSRKQEER